MGNSNDYILIILEQDLFYRLMPHHDYILIQRIFLIIVSV